SSGWSEADKGGVWTVTGGSASSVRVEDGSGKIDVATGGTRELVLASTEARDTRSTISYTVENGPSNGSLYAGIGARYDDQGGYRASAWHRDDGSVWLLIQRNGAAI